MTPVSSLVICHSYCKPMRMTKVAASSSPVGLQRVFHAMKRYGDTWGYCANTDKSHVLLVGPPEAVAGARHHDFRWGSSPLQVVDEVK
jgi:hypothetical protein